MITAGTWMMNGYGRGADAVFSRHMGGDFGMFGPASLVTISILSVMFFLALLWVIAIKGYALWHAAKRNEKWWFVALLVVNTFGILEVIYLLFIAKVKVFDRKTKENMKAPVANPVNSHTDTQSESKKDEKSSMGA